MAQDPYEEAKVKNNEIKAKVISTNKFGSVHLNIMQSEWDKLKLRIGNNVKLNFNKNSINVPYCTTFGDVPKGKPLIIKDDYGRIEVALNQGSFVKKYPVKIGDGFVVRKK